MKKPYEIDQRTKLFAIEIIKTCAELKANRVEYALRDQLLRSGTSVGANVHEGKSSSSRKELARYYEIALKSAHETEFWFDIINSVIKLENFESMQKELVEIKRILASIVLKLKNTTSKQKVITQEN